MIAMFDAQCEACFEDIEEGVTEISYHPDMGWIHQDPDECNEDHPDYDEPFATF